MQSRRGFLQLLGGSVTAAMWDPERLLWVPGAKKIFIPPPAKVTVLFCIDNFSAAVREYLRQYPQQPSLAVYMSKFEWVLLHD